MPVWQDVLFIAIHRNAADPSDPSGPLSRVIELGAQYAIGGFGARSGLNV